MEETLEGLFLEQASNILERNALQLCLHSLASFQLVGRFKRREDGEYLVKHQDGYDIYTEAQLHERVEEDLQRHSQGMDQADYKVQLNAAIRQQLQQHQLPHQATLLAMIRETQLLVVQPEGQQVKLLVLQPQEAQLHPPAASSNEPFGVQLLHPKNKKGCFKFLKLAKDAYEESLAAGFWQIHVTTPSTRESELAMLAPDFKMIGSFLPVGDTLQVSLGFRGTSTAVEGLMDVCAQLVPLHPQLPQLQDVQVHWGFLEVYKTLKEGDGEDRMFDKIAREVDQTGLRKVAFQISGHSLGGALATLAAFELADGSVLPSPLKEVARHVQCVTWGSPRVGNEAFKQRYNTAVPDTARFANKWDIVPWVPVEASALKKMEEEGQQANDSDNSVHAGLQYRAAQAQHCLERCQAKLMGSTGFTHVVEGIQLEIGPFERFEWLASTSLNAYMYLKGTQKEEYRNGVQHLGVGAIEPHFLQSYEDNLKRAFQPSSALNVAMQIQANYSRLQVLYNENRESLQEIWNFSAEVASNDASSLAEKCGLGQVATATELGQMVLPTELGQTAAGTSKLSLAIGTANLALNLVGTAGTWYGMWVINGKVNGIQETLANQHETVVNQIEKIYMAIKQLPEEVAKLVKLQNFAQKVNELKAIAEVIAEDLDLSDTGWEVVLRDNDMPNKLGRMRDAVEGCLMIIDGYAESHSSPFATLLTLSLDAVARSYFLELSALNRLQKPVEYRLERLGQMKKKLQPRLAKIAAYILHEPYQLYIFAPQFMALAPQVTLQEEVAQIDSLQNLVDKLLDGKSTPAEQNRLRAFLPMLPQKQSYNRADIFEALVQTHNQEGTQPSMEDVILAYEMSRACSGDVKRTLWNNLVKDLVARQFSFEIFHVFGAILKDDTDDAKVQHLQRLTHREAMGPILHFELQGFGDAELALSEAKCTLTFESPEEFRTLLGNLPSHFETLEVWGGKGGSELTDEDIQTLAEKLLPGITTLRLEFSQSAKFSDKFLDTLAKKLPQGIKKLHLNFFQINNFSNQAVQRLRDSLPPGMNYKCFRDANGIRWLE